MSQVQFSWSCSQYSESQTCNFQVPVTYFQVLGCQGPRVPGLSVPGLRVPGLRALESQVAGPGSQVLILDYAEIYSNHENCNNKFSLNTFSDQITICQISFEIFDVKKIDTRAKKIFELHKGISLLSSHFSVEVK